MKILMAALLLGASPTTTGITLDNTKYQEAWSQAAPYEHARVFFADGDVQPDAEGSLNQRFPFKNPGGRHTDAGTTTLRYPALPLATKVGMEGKVPVWEWKAGTAYFEVHTLSSGEPFEIRARMKNAEGEWEAKRFRPFTNHNDLEQLAGKRVPYVIQERETEDNAFFPQVKAQVAVIGSVDRSVLKQPLWRDVTGIEWMKGVADATAIKDDSVVPPKYDGWIVANDCATCHQAAGKRVQGPALVALRGGDEIFTDDVFHAASLNLNGVWWDTGRVEANGWLEGQEPVAAGGYQYYQYYNYRTRRGPFRRR
jgi:hypothetical protein